jgi:putative ABC transport system ATP-binding protein
MAGNSEAAPPRSGGDLRVSGTGAAAQDGDARRIAAARTPLVSVAGLDHWFYEGGIPHQVLCEVQLTLLPGEIVILTGPSGSGKTTLLTMLGGLRAAQSGSLLILGTELRRADRLTLTHLRRQIGYIFQAHNLLPYLTSLENVRLGLEVRHDWLQRGRSAMDACAAAMLSRVGLAERLHYYPEKLSGGRSSGWRSPVRWRRNRGCCWPMSPPLRSIVSRAVM